MDFKSKLSTIKAGSRGRKSHKKESKIENIMNLYDA